VIAIRNYAIFVCMLVSLLGCASSIVDGEYLRTSPTIYPPKSDSAIVEVFLSGKSANRKTVDIGRVSARAHVLEKGIDELRAQAKELGLTRLRMLVMNENLVWTIFKTYIS